MPTFTGTVRMVTGAEILPLPYSPLILQVRDEPSLPRLYLVSSTSDIGRQLVSAAQTGALVEVTGDPVMFTAAGVPWMRVTAVRPVQVAPTPPAPAPPPPTPPPVTPPTPPPPAEVRLIGRIRRPMISVQGVTHALIDQRGRTWLLRVPRADDREELDEIEEERDELAVVRGSIQETVQGLSVVLVTSADELDDDDDDNNNNNPGGGRRSFAVTTQSPTWGQTALPFLWGANPLMQGASPLPLLTAPALVTPPLPLSPAKTAFLGLMTGRRSMRFGPY